MTDTAVKLQNPSARDGHELVRVARLAARRLPGPSLAALYLSLLVLLPLAAVLAKAFSGGWSPLYDALRAPQTLAALKLSLEMSTVVVIVNAFAGTAIAWVL